MTHKTRSIAAVGQIDSRILLIRGHRVMLDADLMDALSTEEALTPSYGRALIKAEISLHLPELSNADLWKNATLRLEMSKSESDGSLGVTSMFRKMV